MYKPFFVYAINCCVKENPEIPPPPNRGLGIKTYSFMTYTNDELSKFEEKIPAYEKVIYTDIFLNSFPTDMKVNVESVSSMFRKCTRCNLCNIRTNTVHYRHTPYFQQMLDTPKVVFVGQCPGFYEDKEGYPFVGKSGDYLELCFKEADYRVPSIAINITACIPPSHRKTNIKEEILACSTRLWLMLQATKPNIIVCLGLEAGKAFWDNPKAVSRNELVRMRKNIYVAHSFHPRALSQQATEGNDYATRDFVKFLREVESMANCLPPFYEEDEWYIFKDKPFKFVKGIR